MIEVDVLYFIFICTLVCPIYEALFLINRVYPGARIEPHLEGALISNIDRIESGHIKQLIIKIVSPIIKSTTNSPDYLEEYKNEYGYLGPALHSAVVKARMQPTPPTTVSSSVSASSIASVGATITRSTPSAIIQQVLFVLLLGLL